MKLFSEIIERGTLEEVKLKVTYFTNCLNAQKKKIPINREHVDLVKNQRNKLIKRLKELKIMKKLLILLLFPIVGFSQNYIISGNRIIIQNNTKITYKAPKVYVPTYTPLPAYKPVKPVNLNSYKRDLQKTVDRSYNQYKILPPQPRIEVKINDGVRKQIYRNYQVPIKIIR